ncbi:hypothetical protein [Pricia sp.]|uniref:hypothetical protein n=1 Tax=Pricia sp. TaxID=2268138 RepID=UPI003593B21F
MKSFIIKVLVFVGLFYAADFIAGMVLGHFYIKSKNINLLNTNYGFSGNVKDDILIFGASELSHALIPHRITDKTGMSTYNLACDACSIYYQYPMLETILEAHVPKVIVLSSNQMNEESLGYVTKLYPFYDTNKHVKDLVDVLLPKEYFKLALNGYVYNSKLIRVFDRSNDNRNGYVPLHPEEIRIDPSDFEVLGVGKNNPITADTENYFRKFVQKATAKGVKVYVWVPPILQKMNGDYRAKMTAVVETTGAKIIDFSKDQYFLSRSALFFDQSHLNDDGAKVMTDRVMQILKEDGVY